MKVMLDNGIPLHAEFGEATYRDQEIFFGNTKQSIKVLGFVRKALHDDQEYQNQIDALFTIGRLIREGIIEPYDYIELEFEGFRSRFGRRICNAFEGSTRNNCPPAIDFSKLWQMDLFDFARKGGRGDRKKHGEENLDSSQVARFEWLKNLSNTQIEAMMKVGAHFKLTDFEIESLRQIEWFRFMCERSMSRENYPDIFHLWTAERNKLDIFLTLETKLPDLVTRVRNEKKKSIDINVEVLRPLELLKLLGIKKIDPIPLEPDRIYSLFDLPSEK